MNISSELYFLFDPEKWMVVPWEENIKKIFPYISMIQLRSPKLSDRDFYLIAVNLKKLLAGYKIPLIINNRMDIAISVNADGLHLGINDIPITVAKKYFKGIIGVSRHTSDSSLLAEKDGADYIGCGPIFKTNTKNLDRKIIGIESFLKVKKSVKIPVIPIGGINTENVSQISDICPVIAVSSAINMSAQPLKTVKELNICSLYEGSKISCSWTLNKFGFKSVLSVSFFFTFCCLHLGSGLGLLF